MTSEKPGLTKQAIGAFALFFLIGFFSGFKEELGIMTILQYIAAGGFIVWFCLSLATWDLLRYFQLALLPGAAFFGAKAGLEVFQALLR